MAELVGVEPDDLLRPDEAVGLQLGVEGDLAEVADLEAAGSGLPAPAEGSKEA